MTDEEKAAVEAENSTEQKPAESAAPADDGNNFGESAEDNFGGGFEDNFGLGDDALAAGTIPQAPSAVKKKPPVEPVKPRNREDAASAILSADPSALANAASAPSVMAAKRIRQVEKSRRSPSRGSGSPVSLANSSRLIFNRFSPLCRQTPTSFHASKSSGTRAAWASSAARR